MAALYLIPVPIAPDAWHTIPPQAFQLTLHLKHYVAENVRSCRRALRAMHKELIIEEVQIVEITKEGKDYLQTFKEWIAEGYDVGIMSEAGMPCIADPGSDIVKYAHEENIAVHPVAGPNSIMLALAGSGMHGQHFAFNGYLPVPSAERIKAIKSLEQQAQQKNQTQIFIETPYRNQALYQDLVHHLKPTTLLCIGYNLTANDAFLFTKTIAKWRQEQLVLSKAPAIYLLQHS